MSITVITPTIPERSKFLHQCMESIANQTLKPEQHFVGVDYAGAGPARMRNKLLLGVRTKWVTFLDDDDLAYPHHLETIARRSGGMEFDSLPDVIYTWCKVTGEIRNGVPWNPNSDFDPERLRRENFIPVTAAVRTELAQRVGGFPMDTPDEDWRLWLNLLNAGARFLCVPEITWEYRFHRGDSTNRSLLHDPNRR